MSLPEPLVPQEVDLRGLTFMPLDVARLRDSDLAIEATGDEFRAAVLLWCASWDRFQPVPYQIPTQLLLPMPGMAEAISRDGARYVRAP